MLNLISKIDDLIEEDIIAKLAVLQVMSVFLSGVLGVQTAAGSDAIVRFVMGLFKYPAIVIEIAAAIIFVILLLRAAVLDITAKGFTSHLVKTMIGIFAYCIILLFVYRLGVFVAANLIYVILAGVFLLAASTASVVAVSSLGNIVFVGPAAFFGPFLKAASMIFTFVLAVFAVSVLAEAISSFF